jgi:hypothetical protein
MSAQDVGPQQQQFDQLHSDGRQISEPFDVRAPPSHSESLPVAVPTLLMPSYYVNDGMRRVRRQLDLSNNNLIGSVDASFSALTTNLQ